MRTPKFIIFIRAVAIVFGIYMLMAWAWNSITLSNTWTAWEMIVSAVLTVILFGGFAWFVTNLGMAVLFGGNSDYQRMKRNGFDPYLDSLPWPLNSNSGFGNSRPSAFKFQCPVCSGPVEKRIDVCPACGYGADGDSTAYFKKFGSERPPEISDQEWTEIRRRHGR